MNTLWLLTFWHTCMLLQRNPLKHANQRAVNCHSASWVIANISMLSTVCFEYESSRWLIFTFCTFNMLQSQTYAIVFAVSVMPMYLTVWVILLITYALQIVNLFTFIWHWLIVAVLAEVTSNDLGWAPRSNVIVFNFNFTWQFNFTQVFLFTL